MAQDTEITGGQESSKEIVHLTPGEIMKGTQNAIAEVTDRFNNRYLDELQSLIDIARTDKSGLQQLLKRLEDAVYENNNPLKDSETVWNWLSSDNPEQYEEEASEIFGKSGATPEAIEFLKRVRGEPLKKAFTETMIPDEEEVLREIATLTPTEAFQTLMEEVNEEADSAYFVYGMEAEQFEDLPDDTHNEVIPPPKDWVSAYRRLQNEELRRRKEELEPVLDEAKSIHELTALAEQAVNRNFQNITPDELHTLNAVVNEAARLDKLNQIMAGKYVAETSQNIETKNKTADFVDEETQRLFRNPDAYKKAREHYLHIRKAEKIVENLKPNHLVTSGE